MNSDLEAENKVSFDELLRRINQRLVDFQRSHDFAFVVGDAVQTEAAELLQAATPSDDEQLTWQDVERLTRTHYVLASLHYARYLAAPDHPDINELARAICFYHLLGDRTDLIPVPVRTLIFASADIQSKITVAVAMLQTAQYSPDPVLLDAALVVLGAALETARPGTSDQAMVLTNLCNAHRTKFEREHEPSDIEASVSAGERAVTTAPDDDSALAWYLSNVSSAYLRRFERFGARSDLEHAASAGERSVKTVRAGDPHLAMLFSNLGNVYMVRYERGGPAVDLDQAIEIDRRAVAATAGDHPNLPGYLLNLAKAHQLRYEHFRLIDDLDQAIICGQQAVSATPNEHPTRSARLSNLGSVFRLRARRSNAADLDMAISLAEEAAAGARPEDPYLPMYLMNLGTSCVDRYLRAADGIDLYRATEVLERAVELTAHDHPTSATHLSNLGNVYYLRHRRLGLASDLRMAVRVGEEALDRMPADDPKLAMVLANLGQAYARQWQTPDAVDRRVLLRLATHFEASVTSPPEHRIQAGQVLGRLAQQVDEPMLALRWLRSAMSILPIAAPRQSDWQDQEFVLGGHSTLIGEAIAAHCAVGDPTGAVEIAELGRGVLLSAQLDTRSDLSDLEKTIPDLAEELQRIRNHLNMSEFITHAASDEDSIATARTRRHWWDRHDELLARIRQHPGFERFLLPPRLSDLQPALNNGIVILVNAASQRSDAVVLDADGDPLLLPLPSLTGDDVNRHAAELLDAAHGTGLAAVLRRQRVLPQILGWLWDSIVDPIVQSGVLESSSAELPRVWWLPTGLLGLFPIHAAGYTDQPGALDAMVSSYAPTLRALVHANTHAPATIRRQLAVAMHRTTGLPDLPGTVGEAMTLHAHHPDLPLLQDETATINNVVEALGEATWAHFACHASVDLDSPSRGGLCLHDATLSLPSISRLGLARAELAYLSACSTAHRGLGHLDESLHPASAFQLAGFRHVIASLWPLADATAASTATTFYRHLPSSPAADHAARALHRTTCDLRAQSPTRPDLWAGLIHSGS